MQDPQRSQVMQVQDVGLEQGAEKLMQWHTESSLVECHARHDVSPHRSRRCRIRGDKIGSKLHRCYIPLTYEVFAGALMYPLTRANSTLP
jgi:hypothetical protein